MNSFPLRKTILEQIHYPQKYQETVFYLSVILALFQFKMLRGKLNKEQSVLKKFTDQLITSDDDLVTFGLHLGYTFETVKQTKTNHPKSVEGAALDLVCLWWDHDNSSRRKVNVLI